MTMYAIKPTHNVIVLALLFALSGCAEPQSFGVGPWPIYKEPAALEFTPEETSAIATFAKEHMALFNKLQGQEHSYRAIVRTHNKAAKEMNTKVLKTLGFDETTVDITFKEKEVK